MKISIKKITLIALAVVALTQAQQAQAFSKTYAIATVGLGCAFGYMAGKHIKNIYSNAAHYLMRALDLKYYENYRGAQELAKKSASREKLDPAHGMQKTEVTHKPEQITCAMLTELQKEKYNKLTETQKTQFEKLETDNARSAFLNFNKKEYNKFIRYYFNSKWNAQGAVEAMIASAKTK